MLLPHKRSWVFTAVPSRPGGSLEGQGVHTPCQGPPTDQCQLSPGLEKKDSISPAASVFPTATSTKDDDVKTVHILPLLIWKQPHKGDTKIFVYIYLCTWLHQVLVEGWRIQFPDQEWNLGPCIGLLKSENEIQKLNQVLAVSSHSPATYRVEREKDKR